MAFAPGVFAGRRDRWRGDERVWEEVESRRLRQGFHLMAEGFGQDARSTTFTQVVARGALLRCAVNNPQTNKSTMYATVQAVCEEFRESVWKDHVAYARHFADFTKEAGAIQAWKLVQETARDGVALTKEHLQDLLIDETLPLAGALCALAAEVKDTKLLAMSDLERSDFANLRDEAIDDLAMQLHAKAAEILAAQAELPLNSAIAKLRDYGVDDAMLASVSAAATAYEEVVNAPRLATGKVRTATETIEQHFSTADEILDKQIDKLVRQFKKAHPEFVSRYRNARVIVNVAASRGAGAPVPAPMATPGRPA